MVVGKTLYEYIYAVDIVDEPVASIALRRSKIRISTQRLIREILKVVNNTVDQNIRCLLVLINVNNFHRTSKNTFVQVHHGILSNNLI